MPMFVMINDKELGSIETILPWSWSSGTTWWMLWNLNVRPDVGDEFDYDDDDDGLIWTVCWRVIETDRSDSAGPQG